MYVCMYMYVYTSIYLSLSLYIYIYIHTYSGKPQASHARAASRRRPCGRPLDGPLNLPRPYNWVKVRLKEFGYVGLKCGFSGSWAVTERFRAELRHIVLSRSRAAPLTVMPCPVGSLVAFAAGAGQRQRRRRGQAAEGGLREPAQRPREDGRRARPRAGAEEAAGRAAGAALFRQGDSFFGLCAPLAPRDPFRPRSPTSMV